VLYAGALHVYAFEFTLIPARMASAQGRPSHSPQQGSKSPAQLAEQRRDVVLAVVRTKEAIEKVHLGQR